MAENFYKLTESELMDNWELGLYDATAYLHHILKVTRRNGWCLEINDVSAFCNKWNLKRSSFYRAKAKLITMGLLEEKIAGQVSLRLLSKSETKISDVGFTVPDMGLPVPDVGLPVPDVGLPVPNVDTDGIKSLTPQAVQNSPDLFRSLSDQNRSLSDQKSASENFNFSEELIDFVISKNPGVTRPRAYALACLKHDSKKWQAMMDELLTNSKPQITTTTMLTNCEHLSAIPSQDHHDRGGWYCPECKQGCSKPQIFTKPPEISYGTLASRNLRARSN